MSNNIQEELRNVIKRNRSMKMIISCRPKDGEQITEAAVKLEQLEKHFTDFGAAQNDIENDQYGKETLPNEEAIGIDGFQLYMKIKSELIKIMQHDSGLANQISNRNKTKNENSPLELNIPEFDGNFKNWSTFKDSFTEKIVKNLDISGSQKLDFLKTLTKGKAKDEIENIDNTKNGNFELAWKKLECKFSSKSRLVYSNLKTLIDLKSAKTGPEIRQLCDILNQTLQELENLQQPDNGNILLYLIYSKLPKQVIHDWEMSLKSNDRIPKFKELFDFLKSHIQNFDEVTETLPKPASICSYCKGEGHMITNCVKFIGLPIDSRCKVITNLQVCQNCLKGKQHQATDCKSKIRCTKCKKTHHTLLHKEE